MFYSEETVLCIKYRITQSCLFCSLSVYNSPWLIFLGDSHQFEKGILASRKDNKDYVRSWA
jgi:hypothetical protein